MQPDTTIIEPKRHQLKQQQHEQQNQLPEPSLPPLQRLIPHPPHPPLHKLQPILHHPLIPILIPHLLPPFNPNEITPSNNTKTWGEGGGDLALFGEGDWSGGGFFLLFCQGSSQVYGALLGGVLEGGEACLALVLFLSCQWLRTDELYEAFSRCYWEEGPGQDYHSEMSWQVSVYQAVLLRSIKGQRLLEHQRNLLVLPNVTSTIYIIRHKEHRMRADPKPKSDINKNVIIPENLQRRLKPQPIPIKKQQKANRH